MLSVLLIVLRIGGGGGVGGAQKQAIKQKHGPAFQKLTALPIAGGHDDTETGSGEMFAQMLREHM